MHITFRRRGTVLVTAALVVTLTTSLTIPRVVARAADDALADQGSCVPLDPSNPAQAAELEVIRRDGAIPACPPAVGGSTPGKGGPGDGALSGDALSGDDARPGSTASDQPAPGTQPPGEETPNEEALTGAQATEGARTETGEQTSLTTTSRTGDELDPDITQRPSGADAVVSQVQTGGTAQDAAAATTPQPPSLAAAIEAATAPDKAPPSVPEQPVLSMSTDQGGTTGGARDPDPEPRLDDYGGDTGRWIADHDAWMRRRVDRANREAAEANGGRWPPPNEDAARLNTELAPATAPRAPVMALSEGAGSGSPEWVPDPARPGVEWGPGGRPRWSEERPPELPDAGFDPELYGQLRDSWRRGVAGRARQREQAPDDEQSGGRQAQIVTGPLPEAGPAPVAVPRGQAQRPALDPRAMGAVAGAGGAAIGGYLLWRLLSRSPCLVGGPGLYAVCQAIPVP
jgi:hypothetical protein